MSCQHIADSRELEGLDGECWLSVLHRM